MQTIFPPDGRPATHAGEHTRLTDIQLTEFGAGLRFGYGWHGSPRTGTTATGGPIWRKGKAMSGQAGRSGRAPKPGIIRRAEGNRGKRPLHDNPVGVGKPILPPMLSELELFLWHSILAAVPPGLLTSADSSILERFVTAWARYRTCHNQIASVGLLVRGAEGPVRNPLLMVERQAAAEMHACGAALGLSPVSRARLADPHEDGEDDFAWLLGSGEDLPN
jgi:P27 family predicted phage terminase small subunit